jgi:hypothetical protein
MILMNRMRFVLCFIIIVFCIKPFNLFAQYSAKATLDSSTVLIGKQATLSLELVKPLTGRIQWITIPDSLGGIDVISKGTIDTLSFNSTSVTLRQFIKITAFDSGVYVIPPFQFYSGNPTDTNLLASTNSLMLSVQLVPVDTTKSIRDIRGVRDVPFNWRDYIYYIIAAIVLLHLFLIGLYFYMKIKKKKQLPGLFKKDPEIPPHVVAIAALKKLDEGKHWQNGQYKFYHASISDILRTYIEKRWKIPAMEQTTDEIMGSMMIQFVDEPLREKLNNILRISDLAKFAKLQPLAHENEQSMREALAFINLTIPADVISKKEEQL